MQPKRNRSWDHTKTTLGDILHQVISCEFNSTNNKAEFKAVIMGFQLGNDLQVFIDSLLINYHFNGSYTVKPSSEGRKC